MLKPGKDAGERELRRNKKAILLVTKVDVTRLRVTLPRDRRAAAVRSDPFVPPLGAIDLIADEVALRAPGVGFSTSSNWEETMPEKQIFEIPQQLRELAQKNVEQARAAYGQFMDAMAQAVSAWSSASSDTVTSAFKAVQDGAIRFAKENAEAGFALANELTKAKDLQDVLRLQSSFAQKQMETYARQAQELGRLMAEATRSAMPKS